ncbi:recQ-mediated genome instability protein 1 isoform X2 [Monomorium pharaonis]|uniref:recQ-mediated genome instability protein 1 isoform X2 n=1 Tax=Monomorium pharaonis TaxID=307658 RepID=UPI00174726BD|nr:recQ-mediated genome instability protein 1 isoform X2 [Monomorium pharaonis]
MNENLIKRIKRQLNEKFYVMNDAWLRDCIEFFIEDKTSHEITDKDIFEFVESQWQLSDLREISNETECLPRNLVHQTYTVLRNTYILQVDKMYDIVNAKYKQLCEIRKIDNKNLEVTEAEKSEEEWQPKGRRMMQLYLTDGIQNITAIEYIPMKKITGTLLPGYKVMIIGPVDCRRGIILLKDSNYKEVGGEVESLLKSNALENVLARALGEPENPDPYNDNAPSKIMNQNGQNAEPNSNSSFFDDDFEEAVDLEAMTAIERRRQDTETIHNTTYDYRQVNRKETNKIAKETLKDTDFEPLEDWPNEPSMKSSRILLSRTETEKPDKDNIIIIKEASTSTRSFFSESLFTSSVKNQSNSEFSDDNFDFDDCNVIIKTNESQSQQGGNFLKHKTEMYLPSIMPTLKSNCNALSEVEKCISTKTLENEKLMTISNFFKSRSASKIYDVLSDVLREPITEKIYRTVRGQVKSLVSKLTKQGKCWSLTAMITDHTSSVEMCFNSEILERFLGFTVAEFLQKKKLAKYDPQINNELRLNPTVKTMAYCVLECTLIRSKNCHQILISNWVQHQNRSVTSSTNSRSKLRTDVAT